MAAAKAAAGSRSPLRPGDCPPFPPRHRVRPLAARQGAEAVHVRATGARAQAIRIGRIVRGMSLLFDAPLIAGLKYQEQFISEAEEQTLIERLSTIDLAPF